MMHDMYKAGYGMNEMRHDFMSYDHQMHVTRCVQHASAVQCSVVHYWLCFDSRSMLRFEKLALVVISDVIVL